MWILHDKHFNIRRGHTSTVAAEPFMTEVYRHLKMFTTVNQKNDKSLRVHRLALRLHEWRLGEDFVLALTFQPV